VGTHNTTKDAFIWFLKACKSSDQALVKTAFEQQLLDWVANHGQDMNAIAQQYIDWLGRWEQLDENSFVEESGECSINVQMLQAGRPQSGCLKVGLHFNNGKICGTGSAGTFSPGVLTQPDCSPAQTGILDGSEMKIRPMPGPTEERIAEGVRCFIPRESNPLTHLSEQNHPVVEYLYDRVLVRNLDPCTGEPKDLVTDWGAGREFDLTSYPVIMDA